MCELLGAFIWAEAFIKTCGSSGALYLLKFGGILGRVFLEQRQIIRVHIHITYVSLFLVFWFLFTKYGCRFLSYYILSYIYSVQDSYVGHSWLFYFECSLTWPHILWHVIGHSWLLFYFECHYMAALFTRGIYLCVLISCNPVALFWGGGGKNNVEIHILCLRRFSGRDAILFII